MLRLEVDGESAQLTCLLAPQGRNERRGAEKSCVTNVPMATLPAVWHDNDDQHVVGCQNPAGRLQRPALK